MAKTISVANQKGGVGKTTTVVNLGAGLAELDQRVLLIDLDPQAHLTINMGVRRPDEIEHTAYDLLMNYETHARDLIMRAAWMRIDFIAIACPPSLSLRSVNALVASDEVIIPLQCEYFGMKGMQQLQKSIERV